MSLEELILSHAVGRTVPTFDRSGDAVGVMMIPIPHAGILRGIGGVSAAKSVRGITGVEISARLNYPITPLPEGSSYLGFIFATGLNPQEVETSLRKAHQALGIDIRKTVVLRSMATGN